MIVTIAIVFIANGFFINYMASHGKLKSKSVLRIGYLTLFVGLGLLVPFDWWPKIWLPWWSGIAAGLIIAVIMMVIQAVLNGERRPAYRRRRYR